MSLASKLCSKAICISLEIRLRDIFNLASSLDFEIFSCSRSSLNTERTVVTLLLSIKTPLEVHNGNHIDGYAPYHLWYGTYNKACVFIALTKSVGLVKANFARCNKYLIFKGI